VRPFWNYQTVSLGTWVNKRIGTETRLWEARRRCAAQQEVVERGSEKSPTTSNGARFLSAMGQVNACEEQTKTRSAPMRLMPHCQIPYPKAVEKIAISVGQYC
jgi:hypothetical protein